MPAVLSDAKADAIVLKYEEVRDLLSNLTSRTTSTTREREFTISTHPPRSLNIGLFCCTHQKQNGSTSSQTSIFGLFCYTHQKQNGFKVIQKTRAQFRSHTLDRIGERIIHKCIARFVCYTRLGARKQTVSTFTLKNESHIGLFCYTHKKQNGFNVHQKTAS